MTVELNNSTKEEQIELTVLTYQIINILNIINGQEAGYSDPRNGKIVINKNGYNYLVDIKPLGEGILEEVSNEYKYNL